jgi:hypothetical protein
MKSRRGIILLLILLLAAFVAIFPPTRIRIVGFVRGENTYKGLPTSYWREQAQRPAKRVQQGKGFYLEIEPPRATTWFGKVKTNLGLSADWDYRLFVDEDPAATAVLIDLLKDPDRGIQFIACYGLQKIGPPAKAAVPVVIEILKENSHWMLYATWRELAPEDPTLIMSDRELKTRLNAVGIEWQAQKE